MSFILEDPITGEKIEIGRPQEMREEGAEGALLRHVSKITEDMRDSLEENEIIFGPVQERSLQNPQRWDPVSKAFVPAHKPQFTLNDNAEMQFGPVHKIRREIDSIEIGT